MLVTFESRSYADITMFGDVAVHLLHLMGHSGTPAARHPAGRNGIASQAAIERRRG